MLTHAEIDAAASRLQEECNAAIEQGFPTWSRFAVDQMVDAIMQDRAPDWSWMKRGTYNGVPTIVLTSYNGPVAGLNLENARG